MTTVHVFVKGRVQGVGYRAWVKREAVAKGLSGWVRNRLDGSVEALLSGPAGNIDAMVAACRLGPRAARVATVSVTPVVDLQSNGFAVLQTE